MKKAIIEDKEHIAYVVQESFEPKLRTFRSAKEMNEKLQLPKGEVIKFCLEWEEVTWFYRESGQRVAIDTKDIKKYLTLKLKKELTERARKRIKNAKDMNRRKTVNYKLKNVN